MNPTSAQQQQVNPRQSAARTARALNAYSAGGSADAKDGKNPRWELVEQYLPLVKSIVSRMRIYFPNQVDVEDIYSIGVSGLISATQKYDPVKNPSFGSYAGIRIRGALLDELRRMDWMPRDMRVNVKKMRKAIEELEQRLKRPATDEEICSELKIDKKELSRLKHSGNPISNTPLDSGPRENGEASLQDIIADATAPDGRDVAERNELIKLLRVRLDKLPEMPKKVLAMYYVNGMRLAEIALAVGLTESRICQIHSQAITDLRNALNQELSR